MTSPSTGIQGGNARRFVSDTDHGEAAYTSVLIIGVVMLVIIVRGLRGVQLPSDDEADHADNEPTSQTEDHYVPAIQPVEEA